MKLAEESEGGFRDTVRRDLEEILERRENRLRELVGEDMRRLLEERSRRVEGTGELRGKGGRNWVMNQEGKKEERGRRRPLGPRVGIGRGSGEAWCSLRFGRTW